MKLSAPFACAALLLLSGCAAMYDKPSSIVHQPTSVRPEASLQTAGMNGSIYQAAQSRPLFEDRRARMVGDIITINLVERTTAQKSANASAGRNSGMTGGITTMPVIPRLNSVNRLLGELEGLNVEAGAESTFSGSGAAAANNVFNGTITVTVIDVFPNGNLLVSGEKQIAINQGDEFIRFSGVVNPNVVTAANTVQSTQVADARIEYKGSGFIDEHNTMGWLHRFFAAVFPF